MNRFANACGATGPLVLAVETAGESAAVADTHVFESPFVLIGRDPGCDLRLDHPEISPRHAYLQIVAGRVVCHDLGSRSGVSQGGRRGRVLDLTRDRPLRLGPYRVRLIGGDDPDAPAPPEVAPIVLELSHRGLRTSRHTLAPGLTLAGSGDVPLRLVDPSVSTHHAGLMLTPDGLWVVDLLGPGGLRVDGVPHSAARLEPGETLSLGLSTVRQAGVADAVAWPDPAPQTSPDPTPAPAPAPAPTDSPTPIPATAPRPPRVGISLAVVTTGPAGAPVAEAVAPLPADAARPAPPAPVAAVETASALDAPAPSAELVERLMAPVVREFGRLQQQLVGEFHAARREMMEHVARLYEERASSLDREVENLRRLATELTTLRSQLESQVAPGRRPASSPVAAPAPAPPTALPPGLTVQIAPSMPMPTLTTMSAPNPSPPAGTSAQARLGSAANAGPRPPAGPFASSWEPAVAEGPPPSARLNGGRPAEPAPMRPAAATNGHGPAPSPRLPLPEAKAARLEEDLEALSHMALSEPAGVSNDEIHARLCDRISQIQDPPPGRWRRMLGRLGGRPPR